MVANVSEQTGSKDENLIQDHDEWFIEVHGTGHAVLDHFQILHRASSEFGRFKLSHTLPKGHFVRFERFVECEHSLEAAQKTNLKMGVHIRFH